MTGLEVVGVPAGPEPLTFRAAAGTTVALLAAEGGRATAVLDVLAGLGRQGIGRVLLDGRAVTPRDAGVMQRPVRLLPELTGRENVCLPLLARGLPVDAEAVDQLLTALALEPGVLGNLVEQLSGGQQQRVAIARALITRPRLVCLDEPTTELDDATVDVVWAAIRAAMQPAAIAVIATADAALAARCDQVISLSL